MNLIISISAIVLILWILKKHDSEKSHIVAAVRSLEMEKKDEEVQPKETADFKKDEAAQVELPETNRVYRIADMHFSRGDFGEAEKWLIKVLAGDGNHAEALNKLGVVYLQQGNNRRAEILYRKLMSITQKEPTYYCNYGRCLYNQGRLQDALEAYENAIKLDCTKPTRFVSAGQIYYEKKDHQKALAYFIKALDLDPQNVEYLTVIAELAELTGDTDRLHKSLKKIIELTPYNEEAKAKLAKIIQTD